MDQNDFNPIILKQCYICKLGLPNILCNFLIIINIIILLTMMTNLIEKNRIIYIFSYAWYYIFYYWCSYKNERHVTGKAKHVNPRPPPIPFTQRQHSLTQTNDLSQSSIGDQNKVLIISLFFNLFSCFSYFCQKNFNLTFLFSYSRLAPFASQMIKTWLLGVAIW